MNTPRPYTTRTFLIISAVASVTLLAPLAQAQFRIGQDGRASDANPRVDSGGFNDGGDPRPTPAQQLGNKLVTGNVTGGKEFRGGVPYADPNDFRGNLGSSSFDSFIARSAGAPAPYTTGQNNVSGTASEFYGGRLAVQPAGGFRPSGFTGTYAPSAVSNSLDIDPRVSQPLDFSRTGAYMPKTADLMLGGPIDPQSMSGPTYMTASPLTGIRQWRPNDPLDRSSISAFTTSFDNPLTRLNIDARTIQQMRDELNGPQLNDPTRRPDPNRISAAMPQPLDAPSAGSLKTGPLNTALRPDPDVRPGLAWRIEGANPAAQSSQLSEMQKRLDRYYIDRLKTDEEAYRDALKALRAKEQADREAEARHNPTLPPAQPPQQPTPDKGTAEFGVPDYARISRDLLKQYNRAYDPATQGLRPGQHPNLPAARPAPLRIGSLAEGVKNEGLARILKGAEDQLKAGKYADAIESYEAGLRAAPGNSLLSLGRAYAELAAGYYRKADAHLRQALAADPALLLGQYDLSVMIGIDRLDAVVRDLKDVAQKQPTDPTPVTLLAYVAYNSGSTQQAAAWVDVADQRGAYRDDFLKTLRIHWDLPIHPTADAPTFTVAEVLQQLEADNVVNVTLTDTAISGDFRDPVKPATSKEAIRRFDATLPPGAAAGPLGQWILEHKGKAQVTLKTPPTTEPAPASPK